MDPITAVALAGNILQFAQFTGGLLNETRKLYVSADGATETSLHIQGVCESLNDFNRKIQTQTILPAHNGLPMSEHSTALADCAKACQAECTQLLEIMNKLKVPTSKDRGKRSWKSFRVALEGVSNKDEIERLRARLADRQRRMTLLLSAANQYVHPIGHPIPSAWSTVRNLHTQRKRNGPRKTHSTPERHDKRCGRKGGRRSLTYCTSW